jgi:hypothetical protein
MQRAVFPALALGLLMTTSAVAQIGQADSKGAQRGEALTQRYQLGIIVTAKGSVCRDIVATAPIPRDWPEQEVRVGEEDFTPNVKNVEFRMIDDTVRQMRVYIPYLAPGEEAHALMTMEITRYALTSPPDPSVFHVPKKSKLPRDIQQYLAVSPGIEVRSPKIRSLARTIAPDEENQWKKIETIYDWVRENVEYRDQSFKGALKALEDGNGDCEELSSLFIALCRANGIPARTVWIPKHCYPEFYMLDDEDQGHWIPCQAAGSRAFGEMPEHRPILQKGDNFRVPEKPRERVRYVAEFLTGNGGTPKVKFVRELLNEEP